VAKARQYLSERARKEIASQAKYELARRSYVDYCELVHHGRWKRAKHLDLVCKKLEDIIAGKTKRLMIFMPPRHGKSMTVTKTFPSYFLGKFPDKRVIEVSYSGDLAEEFGAANRSKISEFGMPVFGNQLSQVKATKTNWNLQDTEGGMLSVGVGGSITGQGADLLIIDDPIKNREEAESETYREKLWNEWQSTISTRMQAGAAVVIILTRWHEDDFAGRLLNPEYGKVEDWEILSLPCICEEPDKDLLHRQEGEALWHEAGYDEEWAAGTKERVGTYAWSSLYQQSPTPAGGSIFKREWMNNRYKALPRLSMIIQSWDLPFVKSLESAKCAGFVMGRRGADIYFIDCVNDKMEFTENIAAIKNMTAKHPKARAKVVENKANGPALISLLRKEIPGIVPFEPVGSKEERALSITPYYEAGNIWFPEGTLWLHDFIEDLISFPNGKYKDTIDASVQGILYLMDKPTTSSPPSEGGLNKESYWKGR